MRIEHLEKNKFLQQLKDQLSDITKYKSIIDKQEKMILKLEKVMENTVVST